MWLYDSSRTRRNVGSADWGECSFSLQAIPAHLLDLDRREETLEHGAHQPQLGQLRSFSRLLEAVQDELVSEALNTCWWYLQEEGFGTLHQVLFQCCAMTS